MKMDDEGVPMKKIIKITSYGRYPMYVHAAYHRDGSIVRYFLLNRLRNAAPIDPENVKEVMKLAKAEALDRGLKDVHASTIDYKPKKMREVRIRGDAMTYDQLNDDQKLQVKQDILEKRNEANGEGTSWDELANAHELVSDEEARACADGVNFVPEDFEGAEEGPITHSIRTAAQQRRYVEKLEKSVRKVDTPCERKRYVVVDDGV